jgi:hypothetical protein
MELSRFEKLITAQLLKKFPSFYEPERLLQRSDELVSSLYPKLDTYILSTSPFSFF